MYMNTYTYNVRSSFQIQNLRDVLEAFCIYNPQIGYCQGMNFIVSLCLLIMEPEESFWFVKNSKKPFGASHYNTDVSYFCLFTGL